MIITPTTTLLHSITVMAENPKSHGEIKIQIPKSNCIQRLVMSTHFICTDQASQNPSRRSERGFEIRRSVAPENGFTGGRIAASCDGNRGRVAVPSGTDPVQTEASRFSLHTLNRSNLPCTSSAPADSDSPLYYLFFRPLP